MTDRRELCDRAFDRPRLDDAVPDVALRLGRRFWCGFGDGFRGNYTRRIGGGDGCGGGRHGKGWLVGLKEKG